MAAEGFREKKEGESITITARPGAIVAGWGGLSLVALGVATVSAPLLLVGFCLLAGWGLCRRLARAHLAGLRISRPLPPRAWTGRSFAVTATFGSGDGEEKGLGRRGFRQLAPPPGAFQFRDPIAVPGRMSVSPSAHDGKAPRSYPAKVPRRGRHRFDTWTAVSTWPLGWFEARRRDSFRSDGNHVITVRPAPHLPSALRSRIDGLLSASSLARSASDPAAEFRLLREFRPGDHVAAIHWPASVKVDRLLVREPDPPEPRPSRFGVVIHSFCPGGRLVTPENFETVLKMVAGLLLRLRRTGARVELRTPPGEASTLRSDRDFAAALDGLALAKRRTLASPQALLEAIDGLPGCDEVFVFGDAELALWEHLAASGGRPVTCIDPQSFSATPRVARTSRSRRLAS